MGATEKGTVMTVDPIGILIRVKTRIHIDRETYESPNPTTGEALYRLGEFDQGEELFREVAGDRQDVLVPHDRSHIGLTEDEHFYSQKNFRLIVNLEEKLVTRKKQSFSDIVKLAYPTPPSGNEISYKVSYRKGPPANPKGSLVEGESVKVKNGMVFDVTPTDKS
jgi:Multiubiquitin